MKPLQTVVAEALQTHRDELVAFVRARVAASDVEDVMQVAAVRALERSKSLRDPARVRAWLFRLHRNVMTDVLRASKSRTRLNEQAQREQAANDSVTLPEPLANGLCGCSLAQARLVGEGYASILQLVDFGDSTVAEASAKLGISANNGAVRLHRARAALRKRMLEHCGVTSVRECADCRCVDDGCCA